MNKKYLLPVIFLFVIFLSSCLGQRKSAIVPVPDTEFIDFTLPIAMEDIVESKNGAGIRNMPMWLNAYINGGIEEVERIETYNGKYMFIGMSEGLNFTAMSKWAENFSPARDTVMLVAERIEKKMVASAFLYPDDEYGAFFESFIKNAYSAVFLGAVKEDTYWIKTDIFVFFVLISIDRSVLQNIVQNIMIKSIAASSLTGNQRNTVNRLHQNFFEGF